ncbi:MAG: leucine-rich repeat domain-containing protein [Treponema sp.]|nr:leucine-rich repeat domain-containing protein [Treponema sp.]
MGENMKKIISTILSTVFVVGCLSGCVSAELENLVNYTTNLIETNETAEEAFKSTVLLTESDFKYELSVDGNGICLTEYLGKKTRIRIPEKIEGLPVVSLGSCFDTLSNRDVAELEVVYIPDSVKEVSCFSLQRKLKFVRLPEGLKKIPSFMFMECTSLTEISIPESVEEIEGSAFSGAGLKTLKFPDGITFRDSKYKYSGICSECRELKTVVLPRGAVEIPSEMFKNCTSLTSVKIPDSVKIIRDSAFRGCSNLKDVTWSSKLERINELAFGETALSSVILPNGLKYMGTNAFKGVNPTDLYIPDSYSFDLQDLGFESCGTVRLSDRITKLRSGLLSAKVINLPAALEVCDCDFGAELEELIIPGSLKRVAFKSFAFSSVRLPLKTQKRLRELGYTGSFAGVRPDRTQVEQ